MSWVPLIVGNSLAWIQDPSVGQIHWAQPPPVPGLCLALLLTHHVYAACVTSLLERLPSSTFQAPKSSFLGLFYKWLLTLS